MTNQKMVDVSKWNSNINWKKVKAAGYHAILRCGYGQNIEKQHDGYFLDNVKACTENDIPYGVYLYSYADTVDEAKGEAEHALYMINEAVKKGWNKPSYPVFIDLEEPGKRDSAAVVARRFGKRIMNAGYNWGIYASYSWWNSNLKEFKNDDNCCNWVARWGNSRPTFADIWQYSSKGSVNGIKGNCDVNHCYIKPDGTPTNNNSTTNVIHNSIKDVQKWLNNKVGSGLDVDGIYGAKTNKALVKSLQQELNEQFNKSLSVDGIFGTRTYNACVNVKKGAEGNLTKTLQGALICHGYNANEFKAYFGDGTYEDVRNAQRHYKLSVDGVAGKNTFRALLK